MSPTYNVGDNIRVDVDAYSSATPSRGDVIVFHPPRGADPAVDLCGAPSEPADGHPCGRPTRGRSTSIFIKRIVAVPGDWIEIRNGRVYLAKTGKGPFQQQHEPFVKADPNDTNCSLCNLRKPIRVGSGYYFTAGDNRAASDDSRHWGPVPLGSIIGKVIGKP
jgi:signal peptidase I